MPVARTSTEARTLPVVSVWPMVVAPTPQCVLCSKGDRNRLPQRQSMAAWRPPIPRRRPSPRRHGHMSPPPRHATEEVSEDQDTRWGHSQRGVEAGCCGAPLTPRRRILWVAGRHWRQRKWPSPRRGSSSRAKASSRPIRVSTRSGGCPRAFAGGCRSRPGNQRRGCAECRACHSRLPHSFEHRQKAILGGTGQSSRIIVWRLATASKWRSRETRTAPCSSACAASQMSLMGIGVPAARKERNTFA